MSPLSSRYTVYLVPRDAHGNAGQMVTTSVQTIDLTKPILTTATVKTPALDHSALVSAELNEHGRVAWVAVVKRTDGGVQATPTPAEVARGNGGGAGAVVASGSWSTLKETVGTGASATSTYVVKDSRVWRLKDVTAYLAFVVAVDTAGNVGVEVKTLSFVTVQDTTPAVFTAQYPKELKGAADGKRERERQK